MSGPRWVLHLPTALTRLDEVTELACALRDSLRHVPALDFGELTLSEEDDQSTHHRVWCDAPLDGVARRRCLLPTAHPAPCQGRADGEGC